GLAGVDLRGSPAAVLPAVNEAGELARGPALLVQVRGLDELLHDTQLVVGVEDGKVRLEADQLGVDAQHPCGDRVERAEPGHALDRSAGDGRYAVLHFPRRLVGEGDGEDLAWPGFAGGNQVSEPRRQGRGLAGAGAGED